MIFVEKNGRFGNFLFQYFAAKYIQKQNRQKIIVFSKNENIYNFNSKKNIDKIVDNHISLPKSSKILFFFKKLFYEINESNFHEIFDGKIISKKNIYLNGFFQNIDFIISNQNLLNEVLDTKKIISSNQFFKADLTIHIRHLHHELNTLDTNPDYQIQPDLNFYLKIIEEQKPNSIKVISSNENNKIYQNLKDIFKDKIFFEGKDDITDFFNLKNSKNIVMSVSTFSLWAYLLSKADKVYVPNIGILKKIMKEKTISHNTEYKYI